ncbi:MAG: sugar transferase [Prevotella sp.]|jgi:lipopolysaccharide/colanic/teichoic acid biosynthesis glycosyltransferase|nr:sugar transferase [Prevotella sp.]MDO4933483.1 sugar transferase [Prevotella sp.]
MNKVESMIKRVFDVAVASVCLVAFSPLFVYCYFAVRKEDGGSVIFAQERIGFHGRPFYIYKFRSMRMDAEKNGPALFDSENDDRLTHIGRFLREHHLDELPQLWNVFKGDMSFIGPRPERKFFIDQIMKHDSRYELLYQIRPGVTSYATLYNGYTDTMEKMLRRLEYDLYYLEHYSLLTDAKILFKTFVSIVFGKKF